MSNRLVFGEGSAMETPSPHSWPRRDSYIGPRRPSPVCPWTKLKLTGREGGLACGISCYLWGKKQSYKLPTKQNSDTWTGKAVLWIRIFSYIVGAGTRRVRKTQFRHDLLIIKKTVHYVPDFLRAVLQIRDVCCGSRMFIPDPGSEFFIPDQRSKWSRIRI